MRALFLAAALVAAGCIGSDFGQNGAQDLAVPIFDLSGLDLYGAYNCAELNQCEDKCATPVCIFTCRKNATPTATFEEIALQSCFAEFCPPLNDMGGPGLCAANDMGMTSAACATCINDTYVASGLSCSDKKAPGCHKCLTQATTCSSDP